MKSMEPNDFRLTRAEFFVLRSCLLEAWGGARSRQICAIIGEDRLEAIIALWDRVENLRKEDVIPDEGFVWNDDVMPEKTPELILDAQGWRLVYDVVNASIYGLTHEFSTVTGYGIHEAMNINLSIARVWGIHGKAIFSYDPYHPRVS